jgi:hypothetical protein
MFNPWNEAPREDEKMVSKYHHFANKVITEEE